MSFVYSIDLKKYAVNCDLSWRNILEISGLVILETSLVFLFNKLVNYEYVILAFTHRFIFDTLHKRWR